MAFPPEIYLIGAQKSGTTTLAYLLSQHPHICVSQPKETHFFSRNWSKGLPWYQGKFLNPDTICVDASTSYTMAPITVEEYPGYARKFLKGVPQRIYSINPNARFIYLLRDPVERTYSGYWHYVTNGHETKSFSEAIKNNSFYLDVSNYQGQLDLWLQYFPLKSFLFVLFEDMKKEPEKVAQTCFKFLGAADQSIQLERGKNKSKYVNVLGRQFNRLFLSLENSELDYLIPPYIRGFINKATTNNYKILPKMAEQDRAFLNDYFYEKNRRLKSLTELCLDQWQAE